MRDHPMILHYLMLRSQLLAQRDRDSAAGLKTGDVGKERQSEREPWDVELLLIILLATSAVACGVLYQVGA